MIILFDIGNRQAALAIDDTGHVVCFVKTAATVRDVDASLIVRELLDTVPVETRIKPPERPAVRQS